MSIKRLPAQLANQIAAGEVVERPSSVVKELVENSLDAGASSIEVDIERGGHKRIRIRDNGHGIVKADLELALAPHSTSKIATLDDLENIASLGFRGEALASISSVSRLTLTSKPDEQSEAWSASAQGRDMEVSVQPAAHPNGTTIDVCDLFFNTPARRKFLRAEKTEYQHIEDIVRRIALSRPRVSFVLKHNQKVVKRWPAGQQNPEQKRIAQVCGQQFAERATPMSLTYDGVTLKAWVGGAELMRSATDLQFSFVNGRAMRDKLLLHAIRQAYEAALALPEQPAYVVFIDLNPNDVDVNVHPAKHEVRFQHARQVHDLVCRAFQDALTPESSPAQERDEDTGHNYAPQPVTHTDYIQPLQRTNTERSGYTSRPVATQGRYIKETPSPTAVSAYTELMTATRPKFIQVGENGVLKIDNDTFYWLSAAPILTAWLHAQLRAATLAQPLLMPVSVTLKSAFSQVQLTQWAEEFFHLHCISGKCMLKQVPATLRQLPWGKLFPDLVTELQQGEQPFAECLAITLERQLPTLGDDTRRALDWFTSLPESEQSTIATTAQKQVSVAQFAAWVEQ